MQINYRSAFTFLTFICMRYLLLATEPEPKPKRVELSGSLGAGAWFTAQQGGPARRAPYSWYLSGSPTVRITQFTFPFAFTYSEQDRSFSQPFNRYGVSPYYKWLTLHAGWRNISYSDYTLAGATFLGGGFEANPGRLRIGAIYGKFSDKVIPSAENRSRFSYLLPSYRRMGFAARIGYGYKNNTVDFIVFKARDRVDTAVARVADSMRIAPMENLCLGLKVGMQVFKHLSFGLDGALSLITHDVRIVDSIGSSEILKPYQRLLKVNISTVPYLAGNTYLIYARTHFRVKLDYRRIDPEFQSLGAYYMLNDLQQITVSPGCNIFKNKLMLNLSYGLRKNNLNSEKVGTTENRIGSAFITWVPKPAFAISANYSNYGTSMNNGQNLLNDSILFSVVNNSYGGNVRFTRVKGKKTRSLLLNGQFQQMHDNNIVTRLFTESKTWMGSIAFNAGNSLKGIYSGATLNYTDVSTFAAHFQLMGPALTIRKSKPGKSLSMGATTSYQLKINNGSTEGHILNINLNTGYQLKKRHHFNAGANLLFNNTKSRSIYSFNEQRITLRYSYDLH